MISLQRKRLLKRQAVSGVAAVRKTEAVSRTTQVAHSTVAVGDADVPVVDVAFDATTTAADLPAVQDEVAQAATDSYEAALVAGEAQVSADGKSTVVRSTSAATAAGSYKQGDQWWQFSGENVLGLWLHSGTDWVPQVLTNAIIATLDAGKITTGVLAADRIGALSITTAKLAATAIDGMTVTGATLRTAASGQRMQFDVNGMRAFNASGTVTANLSAAAGGFRMGGILTVSTDGEVPRSTLQRSALQIEAGALVGGVPAERGSVEPAVSFVETRTAALGGSGTSGQATAKAQTGVNEAQLIAESRPATTLGTGSTSMASLVSGSGKASLLLRGADTNVAGIIDTVDGKLRFSQRPVIFTTAVEFPGDVAPTYPTLIGGTNIVGNEFGFCKLNGVIWLTGRVNSGDGVTIYQMPAGCRIWGGADNVRPMDRGGACRVNFKGTGHIEIISGGLVGGGVSFAGTSYLAA